MSVTISYTFGSQNGPLPLSELDTNFAQTVLWSGITGTAQMPFGTTAQRDATPFIGIRYNTQTVSWEGYNGTVWGGLGSFGGGNVGTAITAPGFTANTVAAYGFVTGNILGMSAALPATGSYTIGDIVLEVSAANRLSGWKRQTTGSGNVLGTDWLYFNMPVGPQSMVRLNTANGSGSTNTAIRRFTTVVTNQGSDITYADSATLGALFTVVNPGVYAISYTDQFSGAAAGGISLNTANPTNSILAIPAIENLAVSYSQGAGAPICVMWTGYLPAGSLIRPHTQIVSSGTNPTNCQFTITRVA